MGKYITPPENFKRCTKCLEAFPATTEFFKPAKHTRSGLASWCRTCINRYQKNKYMNRLLTREAREAKQKLELQHPGEKCCGRCKEWKPATTDYYHSNNQSETGLHPYCRDCRSAMRKRTAHSSVPGKINTAAQRRRRRLLKARGTHTRHDVIRQYESQRGACWWCGKKVGDEYHVDHRIPLARGGSNAPENIVISCKRCNLSKGSKLPHEWSGRLL